MWLALFISLNDMSLNFLFHYFLGGSETIGGKTNIFFFFEKIPYLLTKFHIVFFF